MATVTVKQSVNAPRARVWAAWNEFGEIYRYNPGLKASYLINGSKATGLGAERQCDMKDGKNYIRERIVGYIPEERLEIDVYEGSLPMKDTRAVVKFTATGDNRTQVAMTMTFTPKMGLLGKMMLPVMKPSVRNLLRGLLRANGAYVETGATVQA
jgi:ribosome-associated toxin RatA of RatAB toxin-antitoxin module